MTIFFWFSNFIGVSTQKIHEEYLVESMYDWKVSQVYSFALSLSKIFMETLNCVLISATNEQKWVNTSSDFHQILPSNTEIIIHKSHKILEPGFRSNGTRNPYIKVNQFKWRCSSFISFRVQTNTLMFNKLTRLTI